MPLKRYVLNEDARYAYARAIRTYNPTSIDPVHLKGPSNATSLFIRPKHPLI